MRPELQQLVADTGPEDLVGLIGDLEAAKATAWARLTTFPVALEEKDADHLLAMPDVAKVLGVQEHCAREMGRRGELPVVRVGERHIRVREGALRDWIKARERGGTLSRGKR